jgi:hypothetical protein
MTSSREAMAAARTLAIDVLTAEVLDALSRAAIEPILLKGPAIAQWLYGADEFRPYIDVDLLVDPGQRAAAEEVLRQLDLSRIKRDYARAGRLEHDDVWIQRNTAGIVDLHRTLPSVRGTSPERVWRELWSRTAEMQLPPPGRSVRVLNNPALALLVALHAAHHLGEDETSVKPLADLQRARARASREVWVQSAELARQLRAGPQLARGLHAVPGGPELASSLGLPAPAGGREEASGVERFAAAESTGERLGLILHALIPPPDYLRFSSSLARRGQLGLGLSYLCHPFVAAARGSRGFLIWRQDRRRWRANRAQPGIKPSP